MMPNARRELDERALRDPMVYRLLAEIDRRQCPEEFFLLQYVIAASDLIARLTRDLANSTPNDRFRVDEQHRVWFLPPSPRPPAPIPLPR